MSPVIGVRRLHKAYGDTVAIDTPANLADRVDTEQRIQFRPSVPLPDGLLESLPDVRHVIHRGDVVVVTGSSNVLNAVTSVLARNQIVAGQLRVDQANLEDAFLTLTGCSQILPLGVDSEVEALDDQSHAAAARPPHARRA